jgi:hypothetical protein
MKKTAMQELIDELESIKDYKYKELTIRLVKEKLEKEKEQIMNAVDKARNTFGDEFDFSYEFTDGEEYYNQTYNQNK